MLGWRPESNRVEQAPRPKVVVESIEENARARASIFKQTARENGHSDETSLSIDPTRSQLFPIHTPRSMYQLVIHTADSICFHAH